MAPASTLRHITLSLVLVLACRANVPLEVPASVAAPAQAAVESGPTEFRFAWQAPCTVETHTTVSGSDESAEYRQILVLRAGPEAATFVLAGSGFELLRYRGRDPKDPAVRQGVARFLVTHSLPVQFVIDRAGGLVAVTGIDAEALLGVARKLRPLTPEVEDIVRSLFKRPDVQSYFLYLAEREWSGWGSGVNGLRLAPGEEKVIEDVVELSGVPLPRQVTVRHTGAVDDPPGHVRLKLVRIVETHREQVNTGGPLFFFEFGRPPLGERGTHIPMRSVEQIEISTDPQTLRPSRVVYEWSRYTEDERTWSLRIARDFRWPKQCT
jgi:hypothetical protein